MNMRSSNDLRRVVVIFHRAMEDLGIQSIGCNISFMEEKQHRIRTYYSNSSPLCTLLLPNHIDPAFPERVVSNFDVAIDNPIWQWGVQCWRDQQIATSESENRTVEGCQQYFKRSWGYEGKITPDMPHIEPWLAKEYATNVPFDYGIVGFGEQVYNEAHISIVLELTDALSLGYMRFLDFQQLEQQAEQARRERAVERVRAEAMAMRSSDNLANVVAILSQEMQNLGIDTPTTSIELLDEERDERIQYTARNNPAKLGYEWSSTEYVEYDENTIYVIRDHISLRDLKAQDYGGGMIEHWQRGTVHVGTIVFERSSWDMFLASVGLADKEELIDSLWTRTKDKQVVNVPFEYGMIGYLQKGRDTEQEAIVRELGEALSLGYVRFRDFRQLEAELEKAHELQMGLMPSESPQFDGLDIAGRCIAATHVGGDFFQYFQQNGKLSLCMADVTGHAMEAAVPVMMFSGILDTLMGAGDPLADLFAKLNRSMHRNLDKRTFVCLAMGELNLAQRELHLANGGCPYPYHFSAADGELRELQVDAYPLGVRPEAEFPVASTILQPGDYIIFCSDGIIEATNPQETIFGFEQTAATIHAGCNKGLSSEKLIDHLINTVQNFAGDEPQADDMTCIALQMKTQ